MIADALDGVEVGDVERRRLAHRQKGAGDGDGIGGGAKRRLDRPVCGAHPAAGMDDSTVLQVDGGDDGEVVHGVSAYF